MNLQTILEQCGLHHATVLSPTALSALRIQRTPSAEPIGERWAVLGAMSPRMHAEIARGAHAPGFRYSVFETPLGQMFFILTVQAGPSQARILCNLRDPALRTLLHGAARDRLLTVLLHDAVSTDVALYKMPFYAEDLAPLMGLREESELPVVRHALIELAQTALLLRQDKGRLRCDGHPDVMEVTVSTALWSPESNALADMRNTVH